MIHPQPDMDEDQLIESLNTLKRYQVIEIKRDEKGEIRWTKKSTEAGKVHLRRR